MTLALVAVGVSVFAFFAAMVCFAAVWSLHPMVMTGAQGLTGDPSPTATRTDPIDTPWAKAGALLSTYSAAVAKPQDMPRNESGFLLGPLPAPLNPKTGLPILTAGDVCDTMGHAVPAGGKTCPRCGAAL